jgi:DNA-directed RNA polymerase specialized sigma24 family protein
MQKTLAMIFDLEKEIDQQTCELIGKKQETLCLLDQMHAESAQLLSCYYLEGQSTKDLGKTMFLSRRQVQRRLKEALREFQLILSRQSDS